MLASQGMGSRLNKSQQKRLERSRLADARRVLGAWLADLDSIGAWSSRLEANLAHIPPNSEFHQAAEIVACGTTLSGYHASSTPPNRNYFWNAKDLSTQLDRKWRSEESMMKCSRMHSRVSNDLIHVTFVSAHLRLRSVHLFSLCRVDGEDTISVAQITKPRSQRGWANRICGKWRTNGELLYDINQARNQLCPLNEGKLLAVTTVASSF
jgi:hypothetical protein